MDYYYTTRPGWSEWTDVVLCSAHTGNVKEVISSHHNAHNARQHAAKLNRTARQRAAKLKGGPNEAE